jgi:hypothetical protein
MIFSIPVIRNTKINPSSLNYRPSTFCLIAAAAAKIMYFRERAPYESDEERVPFLFYLKKGR